MEQRLIDANALKEWLAAQIDYYKKYSGYNCNAMASAYGAVLERIDNEPTVDAVPVVRCADCKYFVKNTWECVRLCDRFGDEYADARVYPDWFCADGERKDERS